MDKSAWRKAAEAPLVQGGVALFGGIVVGVVVTMRHDVRWLLAFAWPCAIVVVYEFARICSASKRKTRWFTLSGALISAALLLWLYSALAPIDEARTASAQANPSSSIAPPSSQSVAAATIAPAVTPPPLSQEITLHNLFLDDFQTGSYKLVLGLTTPLYKEGRNIGEFPFEIGMYGDFQSKSVFISLYAPASDHAAELISWFANAYKDYLYDARKNIHVWTASPGTQSQLLSDDLVFTKKIYVYYENILSTDQLRTLADLYAKEGTEVEFRGFNYLDYRKKIGPPLSSNFGKVTQSPVESPSPWHPFTPDPANQKQPTLLTLFMHELRAQHGAVIIGNSKLSVHFAPNDVVQTLTILHAVYYDRPRHVISVAVYVPHYIYTPNVVLYAIPQVKAWIDEANKLIGSREDLPKYEFAGDVYIYDEEPIMNDTALDEITKAMRAAGLTLEYRSQDYLAMYRYQVESRVRPMPPMYEWTDNIPSLIPGQKETHPPTWTITGPAVSPPFPTLPGTPAKK